MMNLFHIAQICFILTWPVSFRGVVVTRPNGRKSDAIAWPSSKQAVQLSCRRPSPAEEHMGTTLPTSSHPNGSRIIWNQQLEANNRLDRAPKGAKTRLPVPVRRDVRSQPMFTIGSPSNAGLCCRIRIITGALILAMALACQVEVSEPRIDPSKDPFFSKEPIPVSSFVLVAKRYDVNGVIGTENIYRWQGPDQGIVAKDCTRPIDTPRLTKSPAKRLSLYIHRMMRTFFATS